MKNEKRITNSGMNRSKATARAILLLYAFISATYPLAHKDFVPLDSRYIYLPGNTSSHNLGSNDSDFVCPAHNFAQSTTGMALIAATFSKDERFSFIGLPATSHPSLFRTDYLPTRAPPVA